MNHREWLKSTAALSAGGLLADVAAFPSLAAEHRAWNCETSIPRLRLRHTWTTTISSSEYRDTIQVRLTMDGVTGIGEGAPIVRYQENAEDGKRAIDSIILIYGQPIHGIQEALRMIYVAKSLGMKTMLGCMVSSSVSVTQRRIFRRWSTTRIWMEIC